MTLEEALAKKNLDEIAVQIRQLAKSKWNAYYERNQLVAFISKLYPSHLAMHSEKDKDWEKDWRNIVCVHSPKGQLTWHIHDSELDIFQTLNRKPDPYEDCVWDGHTTEEKYQRLGELPPAKSVKI